MSSVGGRSFAERVTSWREGTPHELERPRAPERWRVAHAGVGSWDEFVDNDPAGNRSYSVYTPAGLHPGTAVPLMVVLHGCTQSSPEAALGTGFNALADQAGFVVVYPEQSTQDNPRRCWNWFAPGHQLRGSGEPAAIARITEQVLSRSGAVTLDRNRVHVMGLSAGGAMAGILAATYPDVYASVGIHSAPQYRAAGSVVTAIVAMRHGGPNPERQGRLAHEAMGPRTRVVPVIVVQGEADRTVWAGNGDRVVRQWLTTSYLASGGSLSLDFARPHARRADRAPGGLSYSVRRWNDNSGRPVVHYWSVTGLGHAWSGGVDAGSYTDPRGPSATEAMCEFFRECSMDRDLEVADPAGPGTGLRTRLVALGRSGKELGRWIRRALH